MTGLRWALVASGDRTRHERRVGVVVLTVANARRGYVTRQVWTPKNGAGSLAPLRARIRRPPFCLVASLSDQPVSPRECGADASVLTDT